MYLHLNCVLMLNRIVWNGNVFEIETVLTLNWIVWYRKLYLHLNCVLMLNWIVWNGTVFDIETCFSINLSWLDWLVIIFFSILSYFTPLFTSNIRTIAFIIIALLTTLQPICLSTFFRCFMSNPCRIQSTRIDCYNFVNCLCEM